MASTGTPWEEVEEENCGKWVNNSVDETAFAMLEVLKIDRDLLRKNSIRYASKFSWAEVAKKMKQLYSVLIKKGNDNV